MDKTKYLKLVIAIIKEGASTQFKIITTSELARKVGLTQQAVSKQMKEMEELGLIERRKAGRSQAVTVTEKGKEYLITLYTSIKEALEGSERELIITGTVFKGLGEGAYYVSLEGYRKQFKEKLGFDPFPGTLNLRLDSLNKEIKVKLNGFNGIEIHGFSNEKRTYGGAKCFKAKVNDTVEGAALIIERSHYGDDVLEVISPYNLRKEFKLKDGDKVSVKVFVNY